MPDDALDLLLARLGPNRDRASFAKVGAEIWVTLQTDAPVSMTQDERVDIGRRAVLEVLHDVCEGAPELRSDWYAVSSER